MCSELTPRARIPDTRMPQFMQPWVGYWGGDGVKILVVAKICPFVAKISLDVM